MQFIILLKGKQFFVSNNKSNWLAIQSMSLHSAGWLKIHVIMNQFF